MTGLLSSIYAPGAVIPRAHEGLEALTRIGKRAREVRWSMDTLENILQSLRAPAGAPALHDLEEKVWMRVREKRANAVVEGQWRRAQLLAASFALITGIAFGGAEASSLLRAQPPSVSLTMSSLAPSVLLERHE